MNTIRWLHRDGNDKIVISYKDNWELKKQLANTGIFSNIDPLNNLLVISNTNNENVHKLIKFCSTLGDWEISTNIIKYYFKHFDSISEDMVSKLNDSQKEALSKLLINKHLINCSGYGSGKTFFAKFIHENLKLKTLLVAPSYLSHLWDGYERISLSNKFNKAKFKKYDLLVIEEAHLLKGKDKLVKYLSSISHDFTIVNSANRTMFLKNEDKNSPWKDITKAIGFSKKNMEVIKDQYLFCSQKPPEPNRSIVVISDKIILDISNLLKIIKSDTRDFIKVIQNIRNDQNIKESRFTADAVIKIHKDSGTNLAVIASSKIEQKILSELTGFDLYEGKINSGNYIFTVEDLSEGLEFLDFDLVVFTSPYLGSEGLTNMVGRFYRPAVNRVSFVFLCKNDVDQVIFSNSKFLSKRTEATEIKQSLLMNLPVSK